MDRLNVDDAGSTSTFKTHEFRALEMSMITDEGIQAGLRRDVTCYHEGLTIYGQFDLAAVSGNTW